MSELHDSAGHTTRRSLTGPAIRGSALGLLIGGAVCLYFGFSLIPDAPMDATPDEQQRWFAVDEAFNWGLRVVGAGFVLAAALAAAGMRSSMLLATVVESLFAILMIAMTIGWTADARAIGAAWNPQVIILIVMAVVGIVGAKHSWELYRATGVANSTSTAA